MGQVRSVASLAGERDPCPQPGVAGLGRHRAAIAWRWLTQMKLWLNSRLDKCEICHYADDEQVITSMHTTVRVSRRGAEPYSLALPQDRLHSLGRFRLLRRALRLDKCNVLPVGRERRNLVIIRGGKVYHYDSQSAILTKTLELRNCRNVLHQSVCAIDDNTVFFGEYGGNPSRREVPVYRSLDGGRGWETVFAFPAGKIKHVHGCFWDPFEERVWILTGDFQDENHIVVADLAFKDVEWLGDGSQTWRACNVFFERDYVAWIMDSQLEDSYLVLFDRKLRTVAKGEVFPGPVWYSKRLEDGYYLAATACEIGPGVKDNCAHLMVSKDLRHWFEIHRFRHDGWPKKYFKFGVIGFADGRQASDCFYLFGEALRGLDGRVYKCSIGEGGTSP